MFSAKHASNLVGSRQRKFKGKLSRSLCKVRIGIFENEYSSKTNRILVSLALVTLGLFVNIGNDKSVTLQAYLSNCKIHVI